MPNSQMKKTAKGLAAQGRYGDSVLVHMSPGELAGLKALAYEHGTEMTINPITGLPEAFKLKKLFKKFLTPVMSMVGTAFGIPPWLTSAVMTKLQGGSWKDAIKSGAISAVGGKIAGDVGGKLAGVGKTAAGVGTGIAGTGTTAATDLLKSIPGATPSATDMLSKTATGIGAKIPSAGLDLAKGVSQDLLTPQTSIDAALKSGTGEGFAKIGQDILKTAPGKIMPVGGKMDYLRAMGKGASTGLFGGEAGRAAGLTALGGPMGAASMGLGFLASGPKSKTKSTKTDPAKYWVGKGKPMWNPGKFNYETGEFEGQGYGDAEYTEDPAIAARGFTTEDDSEDTLNAYSGGSIRGYADGGNVNTEISDVLSPADASNLSGLAAVNYGDPANVNLNRSAEYGPPQGTYDMPANMPVNRQADLSRDIPMQQRFVQNVPDFDLSGLTTGMSTAGRDPDMAPTPERLGAYYKNLMSGGGGQTAARSLAPLESYMAKVEQGLAPRPPSTTTPADRVGNVASMIGTGSSQGGGQFVMDSEGKLDWVPSGTSFMQRSAGEVDPNIAAMITALGLKIPTTTTPSTDPAYDPVKMKEAILADPAAKAKVLAAIKARAAAGTPTTTAPKMGDTKTDGGKLFVFDGRTWTSIPSFRMASGGSIRGYAGGGSTYAAGGKLLRGPGDGMSDSIPAVIQGRTPQRAALGDGEFVVPADVVASLGNGSTEPGAKQLYAMMDRVRMAKNGRKKQPKAINARKYLPA